MKESLFRFSDPHIDSFSIQKNIDFDQEKYSGFNIAGKTHKHILKDNQEAMVSLTLKIGDDTVEFPFVLKMQISARFTMEEASEKFDSFLDTNAPALLLSYARPVISLMTAQCGFKSFHIPFMTFK